MNVSGLLVFEQHVRLEVEHAASPIGAVRAGERLLPSVGHVVTAVVVPVVVLLAAYGAGVLHVGTHWRQAR